MVDRKKFNMEMGAYLKTRKKISEQYTEVPRKYSRPKPEFEEGVHVEYDKPSRPGFFRRLFSVSRRTMIEDSEELSPEEKEKLMEMEAEVEGIEEEMTEMDEMETELEERREGIIERLMSMLGFGRGDYVEDYDEDVYGEQVIQAQVERQLLDEDVKEVLRIAHSWIEKLPSKHKKDFKSSEDFEKYVNILQRYELVRTKPTTVEKVEEV